MGEEERYDDLPPTSSDRSRPTVVNVVVVVVEVSFPFFPPPPSVRRHIQVQNADKYMITSISRYRNSGGLLDRLVIIYLYMVDV